MHVADAVSYVAEHLPELKGKLVNEDLLLYNYSLMHPSLLGQTIIIFFP